LLPASAPPFTPPAVGLPRFRHCFRHERQPPLASSSRFQFSIFIFFAFIGQSRPRYIDRNFQRRIFAMPPVAIAEGFQS
jgi:hypothetical protein